MNRIAHLGGRQCESTVARPLAFKGRDDAGDRQLVVCMGGRSLGAHTLEPHRVPSSQFYLRINDVAISLVLSAKPLVIWLVAALH